MLPPLDADGLPTGWPQDWDIPTLGPDVLAWSETELAQPDGDGAGGPWLWRESQARFVSWWYALDPDSDHDKGVWLFRRGQVVLPKGSGKSPIAAALSSTELAGPVLPHWDGSEWMGVAHPSPWVQLAAVSQDQTDNTMTLVLAMLREGRAARSVPGLDTGITRVLTRAGRLQPVTASAQSREGQRLTAAILDESHLWTASNGGVRLAATIRRNLAKMGGRSIETTNAWIAGELSVAEQSAAYADKVAEGDNRLDRKILRWHPIAPVEDLSDEVELRSGLTQLYADSPWIDIDRLVDEIYDLGTSPSDARRFYLNQLSAEDDAWLAQYEWAACGPQKDGPHLTLHDGDTITLGFDGSKHRAYGVTDATALIACRVGDGLVAELGVWEQPEGARDWEVPTLLVEATVFEAFDRYNVVGFYADPAKWDSYVAQWEASYGGKLQVKSSTKHPIEWWMTGNRNLLTVRALEKFHGAVLDHELSHDGSSALSRHVLNARRRSSRVGVQIAKPSPDSAMKIDAAVAAVLAWQCRLDAIAAGVRTTPLKPVAPRRLR